MVCPDKGVNLVIRTKTERRSAVTTGQSWYITWRSDSWDIESGVTTNRCSYGRCPTITKAGRPYICHPVPALPPLVGDSEIGGDNLGLYIYPSLASRTLLSLPDSHNHGCHDWLQSGSDRTKMGQIRDFFWSDFSCEAPKFYTVWKSPGFVPFMANLTHFGAKPTIPAVGGSLITLH